MTTVAAFNRLSIAVHDFEQAVAYTEEARHHAPASLAYEALVFAAIVSYFRPFSPNEKDKNAPASSLLKLEDFSPLTSEQSILHERCRDLRNQALAHSAYKYNPTRLDTSLNVIASSPFSLLAHAPNLEALSVLAQKLAFECHHKRADYVRNKALYQQENTE